MDIITVFLIFSASTSHLSMRKAAMLFVETVVRDHLAFTYESIFARKDNQLYYCDLLTICSIELEDSNDIVPTMIKTQRAHRIG